MQHGGEPSVPLRRGRSRQSASPSAEKGGAKRRKLIKTTSPDRFRITDDTDFARDDWDGRIKRCEERIKQGYAKETFEQQLEQLKQARDLKLSVMKQFPGKGWEVIQRLESLRTIRTYLQANNDPCKELPNVEAIIAAYEAGTLEWNDNATYWCQGKMIGGPSPFSFETFHKLNTAENRGDGGFWVEGIYCLPLKQQACKYRSPPSQDEWDLHVEMTVRLDASIDTDPNAKFDRNGLAYPEYQFEFLDDTGSVMLTIFNDDMLRMMGGDTAVSVAPFKHLMGYQVFDAAGGFQYVTKIIAVQVNMMGENEFGNHVYMAPWNTVCCSVYDTNSNTPGGPRIRLNGNWLRKTLFTASAPSDRPRLYVGLNKTDLMARDMVPNIKPHDRLPPEFVRPQADVAWHIDMVTGLYYPVARFGIPGMVPPGGYIPPAGPPALPALPAPLGPAPGPAAP